MMAKKKKNKKDPSLVVLNQHKGAFSWAIFWDEMVLDRWKELQRYFRESGYSAFFTSPFQAHNRNLLLSLLLVLGLIFGFVPRYQQLYQAVQLRHSESEVHKIKNSTFSAGDLSIRPLASSQYEKGHLLAFMIEGETEKGVSSVTEDFTLVARKLTGFNNSMKKIKVSHLVLPVSANQRLLLAYIDTKDSNEAGNITLTINQPDLKIKQQDVDTRLTMQFSVYPDQPTTELYNAAGIQLTTLSKELLGVDSSRKSTAIAEAREKLEKSLKAYDNTEKRLDKTGIQTFPTLSAVKSWVREHQEVASLTDDSDLDSYKQLEEQPSEKNLSLIGRDAFDLKLISNGQTYTRDSVKGSSNELTDDPVLKEVQTVDQLLQTIISNVSALNQARVAKYNDLKQLNYLTTLDVRLSDFVSDGTLKEMKVSSN